MGYLCTVMLTLNFWALYIYFEKGFKTCFSHFDGGSGKGWLRGVNSLCSSVSGSWSLRQLEFTS